VLGQIFSDLPRAVGRRFENNRAGPGAKGGSEALAIIAIDNE
jgi:hypothetical protein